MRIIFGIGNPGIRYELTRHNAGFLLLDYLADKLSLNFRESNAEYLEAVGKLNGNEFILVKPGTYVNNSGIAAKQIVEKFSVLPEEFLVVCDDTNLINFDWRVRLSGGDGGHNGLSSIIYHLMTDEFPRVRIGIGSNPPGLALSEYVLSGFSKTEIEELTSTFKKYSVLIEEFIVGGSKKMLEANSVLIKSDNHNNLN